MFGCPDRKAEAPTMKYFLSLGSNLGDRRKQLAQALAALQKGGVRVLRFSSLYLTQPVGYADQPWFYNQVVEVSTDLEPAGLLALIKKVERNMGRRPARINRPRPIDIDILLAEDRTVSTKKLVVPHPHLAERKFVLVPLLEIAPGVVHPIDKKRISELRAQCPDQSAVIKISPKGELRNLKE
jgi:2-amino-4-hydroxy-6-hydroxymethyldihydropteridine diphosphokinase